MPEPTDKTPVKVEVTAPLPVTVSTPQKASVMDWILRLLLFLVGLTPYAIWVFESVILRKHTDPNLWIMIPCLGLMLIVANVSDNKFSKSTEDIVTIANKVRIRTDGSGGPKIN